MSVMRASEWVDAEPLDLARHLGWEELRLEENSARVLVVRGSAGASPVLVRGAVGIRLVAGPALLTLPEHVLCGPAAGLLEAVVIEEGKRPMLVVSPLEICRLFLSRAGAAGER